MNRSEYIAQLTAALRGKLAFDEIEDIVRDYQEFFDEGVRQGKSEEQVAAELGNPRDVAQQILSEERETPSSGTASSEGRRLRGIDISNRFGLRGPIADGRIYRTSRFLDAENRSIRGGRIHFP